jgi:hypothetical protein
MVARKAAMSDGWRSTYRYGSVRRQMARVAGDHERRVRQAWIERILDILDDDNLIAQAAKAPKTEEGLLFDCNVAPLVWDDPRLTFRLKQLAANDVKVELIDHEHEVAGRTFKRAQIRIVI